MYDSTRKVQEATFEKAERSLMAVRILHRAQVRGIPKNVCWNTANMSLGAICFHESGFS